VKLATLPGAPHLTYCTNIHAGESWQEVKATLERRVTAVKARVSPDQPFGVGLRLSARAAAEVSREELSALARTHGFYVFTINAFPYGAFHGTRVKEDVYRPDWREDARVTYTLRCARLLAAVLPAELRTGSVSTVPVAFAPRAGSRLALEEASARILEVARGLAAIENETGRRIVLALEPEPACLLETTSDAVRFYEEELARRAGVEEPILRAHVGVCLDACHAAVELEEPNDAVSRLERAGIAIAKIQLSAGLEARGAAARAALGRFCEDTYLHQTVVRRANGSVARYLDLPEALREDHGDAMLRTHFHVPIFAPRFGALDGTQPWLAELLGIARTRCLSEHLEIETYTWDVLPAEHRGAAVEDDIAREVGWVKGALGC
jgi:sugar phosphate isomerase/epimerase